MTDRMSRYIKHAIRQVITTALAALATAYAIDWLRSGIVRHNGVALDESDVTTLIGALSRDLPLWPLEACTYGDADATEVIEGRSHCAAHAAGFRMAEAESERAS